MYDYFVLVYFT